MPKKDEHPFETEMNEIHKSDIDQSLATTNDQQLMGGVPFAGINDIEGLEEVSAKTIPLPFCRLVQPTSTKIELVNGKDAEAGTFFFNDTQTFESELMICILKAKHTEMVFERDGQPTPVKKLGILAVDMNNMQRVFVLSLSVMSFMNFGSLIAKVRADQQSKTTLKEARAKIRDYVIRVTSEKQENEKGKYYVAKFELVEKIAEAHMKQIEELYNQYIASLDRNVEEDK